MRIDESSRQELRESQATFQELTSQMQELQDRVAREMEFVRYAQNRQRRAREGPCTFVCVQTPFPAGWHTQAEKGELTSCRGTV